MDKLQLLKQAIMNEVEGYEFYRLAAEGAKNPSTAGTFMTLAKEEEKHAEWLRTYLDETMGKEALFELAVIPAPPSPEIFRWDNIDEEDVQRALTVFSVGMQMEKASAEFYEKGAEQFGEDAKLKELFLILMKWEQAHYEQFLAAYNELKDEFWAEQGFAPF
ncbi:MAG TPA: ferritin family protein [Tissierellia bacterium]|jgi:rubrerythrin|nr:ferritin family protein [Tissierellia bacterium]